MKKRPGTKLGDLASEFMAQWNACKERQPVDGPSITVGERDDFASGSEFSRHLRNWDRENGGAPQTVALQACEAVKGASRRASEFGQLRARAKPQNAALASRPKGPSVLTSGIAVARPSPASTASTFPRPPVAGDSKPLTRLEKMQDPRLANPCTIEPVKIRGVTARALLQRAHGPVDDVPNARLATLGLDFGTAFTKAVVRWEGRHRAVEWSDSVEVQDPYLLPSVFCEHADGSCALGIRNDGAWRVHDGIKLRLLSANGEPSESEMADAVVFLALAFRHVNFWLRSTTSASAEPMRWRLHVGLPTQSWDDNTTSLTFRRIAQAARLVACGEGRVCRIAAIDALRRAASVDRPAIDVFPEFSCQLFSYLLSSEKQDDLHALVDIGAGTMDVAFFNVHTHREENVLPIFSSGVDRLGAHYLISALAGEQGTELSWDDSDSSLSDAQFAKKVGVPPRAILVRRKSFHSRIAKLFNGARKSARSAYETSPAFKRGAGVRLFVCGGGSRIQTFREQFELIRSESAKRVGVNFVLSELVRPSDLVGKIGSNFDRLSVAYGLSQNAANIGNAMRSADLQPLVAERRAEMKDRDEDR